LLIQELSEGAHWVVLFSLASGSFSSSHKPVLRNQSSPMGLPDLSKDHLVKVNKENQILEFALIVGELCSELGVIFFLESVSGSLVEFVPELQRFDRRLEEFSLQEKPWELDFCAFGGRLRRRTKLRSNFPGTKKLARLCPGCPNHLSGREVTSSERAGSFPEALAQEWAELLMDHGPTERFRSLFPLKKMSQPVPRFVEDDEIPRESKSRAPPLAESWGSVSRWTLAFRGEYRKKEHINVLEARVALMAVRRASRGKRSWKRRILGLSDSQAVCGAFAKGRSSSRSFVSLCRRLGSIQLGLRLRLKWRWIETWRNNPDLPSRGGNRPGVK